MMRKINRNIDIFWRTTNHHTGIHDFCCPWPAWLCVCGLAHEATHQHTC